MSSIKNIRFDGKFEPLDFAMRIQNVNVNTRLHRTQLIFILPLKNAGHLPKTTEKHNSNELSARWLFLFSCIFAVCSQSFPVFYLFDIVFSIFFTYIFQYFPMQQGRLSRMVLQFMNHIDFSLDFFFSDFDWPTVSAQHYNNIILIQTISRKRLIEEMQKKATTIKNHRFFLRIGRRKYFSDKVFQRNFSNQKSNEESKKKMRDDL